jgi:hypothetical protein
MADNRFFNDHEAGTIINASTTTSTGPPISGMFLIASAA